MVTLISGHRISESQREREREREREGGGVHTDGEIDREEKKVS